MRGTEEKGEGQRSLRRTDEIEETTEAEWGRMRPERDGGGI